MSDVFRDERGVIRDLLAEPIDSVTEIRSVKGAIRGNHVHPHTTQWTYIIIGKLRIVTPAGEATLGPGKLWMDPPGTPHAWEAVTGCTVLVFTRGPRSGESYESDTLHLDPPMIP